MGALFIICLCCALCYDYYMIYLIHAAPVHPSLCLRYFLILLFTTITFTISIVTLLVLLQIHHCCHHIDVTTNKWCQASLFPGVVGLTTQLLSLINILWLPLCRINKFGFYFPRRLLRSPIRVGHQEYFWRRCRGA